MKRHKARIMGLIEETVRKVSKIRHMASRFATAFCLYELETHGTIDSYIADEHFWRRCIALNSTTGKNNQPSRLYQRNGRYPEPQDLHEKMDNFASNTWWPSLPADFEWQSRTNIVKITDYHAKTMSVNLKILYETEHLDV